MTKPEPYRLTRDAYPVGQEITTRVSDIDVLVAELKIRYMGEGFWPGTVEVRTGIVRLGSSAFTMGQGLWQNGACIGLCDTVLVHAPQGKTTPLPDEFRGQLERYLLTR